MPTYEYKCRDCGEGLEVVQSFSEDSLTVCPSCDGELRKVFSAAGIIFKGSGWHIKDYAGKGPSSTTAAPGGESGDSSSTSDSASDKKSTGKDVKTAAKTSDTSSSTTKPKKSSSPKDD
jgi:putative FmdB family regulatory protein